MQNSKDLSKGKAMLAYGLLLGAFALGFLAHLVLFSSHPSTTTTGFITRRLENKRLRFAVEGRHVLAIRPLVGTDIATCEVLEHPLRTECTIIPTVVRPTGPDDNLSENLTERSLNFTFEVTYDGQRMQVSSSSACINNPQITRSPGAVAVSLVDTGHTVMMSYSPQHDCHGEVRYQDIQVTSGRTYQSDLNFWSSLERIDNTARELEATVRRLPP